MKTLKEALLKEALFNKKNLENNDNPYSITKEDMYGEIDGFPVGVVIRMMEEQEAQGNMPNVKVFQKGKDYLKIRGGFDWDETSAGWDFWYKVVINKDFDHFFEKYPEYEKYN